jgi:hypothetical protein
MSSQVQSLINSHTYILINSFNLIIEHENARYGKTIEGTFPIACINVAITGLPATTWSKPLYK